MKKLFVLILFLGSQFNLFAQDYTACENIVNITVDAVNTKSISKLDNYLSSDFICSGQPREIAKTVLKQLVVQLNENITEIRKVSEQKNDDGLTLVYEFNYANKMGKKDVTFVFNPENQLKQLDLVSIQVKQLKQDPSYSMEKPDEEIITIPIKRHGKLITATAKVNGVERNFIIDNGAPMLIFNSKYQAGTNDTTKTSLSSAKGVNSTIPNMDIATIDKFEFYGIKASNKDFPTLDLSHLEDGTEVYGLLGYDVYKDYDMLFDYKNNTLMLIKPEATESYIKRMQYRSTEIPLDMANYHISYITASLGDKELKLGIDCGAGGNLLDKSLFNDVRKHMSAVKETDLRGASAVKNKVLVGKLKELQIGDKKFVKTRTVFNDMNHLNDSFKTRIDGLIGYEILSKQKTILSYINKKLIFIE